MKTNTLLCIMLLAGTGMLSAADPVKNLYVNSVFKSYVDKNGTIRLLKHWYEGKILETVKEDGKNAVKFQSVSVRYGGFNAVLAGAVHKLPPGKYCFSVWCKVLPGEKAEGCEFRLIHRSYAKANKKRHESWKKYTGADKPVPGKWRELTGIFEIKDTETGGYFLFGHYSRNQVTVWYAEPSIERLYE